MKKLLVLPKPILEAWQTVLLEIGRFPRGTRRTEETPGRLLQILANSQKWEVEDLRQIFNEERGNLSKNLLSDKKELVPYLLGFHLANAARMLSFLLRAQTRWDFSSWVQASREVRLVDLGCGSGAMAQVWMLTLRRWLAGASKAQLAVHLVDQSQLLLSTAKTMLERTADTHLFTHRCALEDYRFGENAENVGTETVIYTLGYVWNELGKNPRAREKLLKAFQRVIEKDGQALISILEPATQKQTRAAMELREVLRAMGYAPLYPCPHNLDCPMLARSRDWCYSEFPWQRPKIQEYIDKASGADRMSLAGAGFLFASPAVMQRLRPLLAPAAVVVGRPVRKEESREDYLLCRESGVLDKEPLARGGVVRKRGEVR